MMTRQFTFLLLLGSVAVSQTPSQVAGSGTPDTMAWHAVSGWGVEGRGWSDVGRFYDRLPSGAEGVVRKQVWELSHHSAGMSCRFTTNAEEIRVRYVLLSPNLAMPHMPATGVSGVDLYVLMNGREWRWAGTVQPRERRVSGTVIRGMQREPRTYMLDLPLYNGLDSLEIGVPRDASFTPIAPRTEKPVVFYGTSIMQGGCASRPGMAIPALIGRWLDVPVINLGFSGYGKMDPEMARLMGELDAAVYVVDCLPNLRPEDTAERTEPFVRLLREARPGTPILLVEGRTYPNAFLLPGEMKSQQENRTALSDAYHRLLAAGVKNLYYLKGEELLGDDGEATVDGSHPTDLGMMRYADAYEKALEPLLKGL